MLILMLIFGVNGAIQITVILTSVNVTLGVDRPLLLVRHSLVKAKDLFGLSDLTADSITLTCKIGTRHFLPITVSTKTPKGFARQYYGDGVVRCEKTLRFG